MHLRNNNYNQIAIFIVTLTSSYIAFPERSRDYGEYFGEELLPQNPVYVTQYFRNYGNPRNLATYTSNVRKDFLASIRCLHCRIGIFSFVSVYQLRDETLRYFHTI